jgi:hypothetical protein
MGFGGTTVPVYSESTVYNTALTSKNSTKIKNRKRVYYGLKTINISFRHETKIYHPIKQYLQCCFAIQSLASRGPLTEQNRSLQLSGFNRGSVEIIVLVFWAVTPCSLVDGYQRFGVAYLLS